MSSVLSFLAKTPAKLSSRPSLIKNNLIKSVNFSKLSTILDEAKETVFLCRQTYVCSLIDQRQLLSIDNSSRPISARNRIVIEWQKRFGTHSGEEPDKCVVGEKRVVREVRCTGKILRLEKVSVNRKFNFTKIASNCRRLGSFLRIPRSCENK